MKQTAEELAAETGSNFYPIVEDLQDHNSIKKLIDQAAYAMGGIDDLVNNGVRESGSEPEDFNNVQDDLILQDFEAKFMGNFRCMRAVVPYMKK